MVAKTPKLETKMICSVCNAEFTGKKCPECGNAAGNKELALDGIPTELHKQDATFGNAVSLKPTDVALNEEYLMNQELARSQREEMQSNLRDSFVLKSQLKKLELEEKLRQKNDEYTPIREPPRATPQPEPPQMQMPNMFQPNTMNPQAQFMNHFMKFDADERKEFLDQLAEADPAAMNTLSGFFTQPQQMMQQQPMMNPYMQPPMNPYQQYPPPWMQQQQQQEQPPLRDPTKAAIDMVDKLQEMSERRSHNEPSEAANMITGLREELKAMNERIANMQTESRTSENTALMQRLGEMENHVFSPKQGSGIKDQIHDIKSMVTDLQDIGFMQKPESSNTVEEQIQLDQAKHQIEMENRDYEIKSQKLKADMAKKDMNKNLVKGLFQRQLQKTLHENDEAGPPASNLHIVTPQTVHQRGVYDDQEPAVVIEEIPSDAGTVRETRKPVSKPEEHQ